MRLKTILKYAMVCFCFALVAGCQSSKQSSRKIIDLTHHFDEKTIYWPTEKGFRHKELFRGETGKGFFYSAYSFTSPEHGGTHIDAPIHFANNTHSVDEIPLERLIGAGVVIDVSEAVAQNRDYLVTIEDFKAWESRHGKLPENVIVVLRTGFYKRWPDRASYLGTRVLGPEAVPLLHFPGLDPTAAEWLVNERKIAAIGIDTASIDYGQSTQFKAHTTLMKENIPAFENLANLGDLPPKGFELIALPMKIRGGSGGPLRIIAILR